MKLLLLADEKPDRPITELAEGCDVIALLGDLFPYWLEELAEIDLPIVGVHGNHDFDKRHNPGQEDIFEKFGGVNLHLNIFEHKGIKFTGFDGAMGYIFTENDAPYYREEIDREAMQKELNQLQSHPAADIFITHFPSIGVLDMPFLGHKGLQTFRDYIDRVNPKFHFHGHVHKDAIAKIGETEVHSVFPYKTIEI